MASGSGRRAVLSTMLDRLLANLMAGPNMNCRPHASRQRVDLTLLSKLNDATPESVLHGLLGEDESARVAAKVRTPRKADRKEGDPETEGQRKFREQQSLLSKLRLIVNEAETYENDTGVAALAVGFPLLVVPPAGDGDGRRILAPVAFVPVSLAVKAGATPAVELARRAEAGDRVRPNAALLAWIEQQTGHAPPPEDDDDSDPWGELAGLIAHVSKALDVANPFSGRPEGALPAAPSPTDAANRPATNATPESPEAVTPERTVTPAFAFALQPAPRGDEDWADTPTLIPAAVLGLFPVPNQGLLRDTRALMSEDPPGPIRSFLTAGVDFDAPPKLDAPQTAPATDPTTTAPWLAAAADPCQARAVALARDGGVLVVHGPPGTGKSQTITNVIADHLYRGQRVLLVCDKRTALDVVADRLGHLGLRNLCGIVHDPRRDQRDLYRTLKQQLDDLAEARTKPQAEGQLARADADLKAVHDELQTFHRSLMVPTGDAPSFSDLVGQWLALGTDPTVRLDERAAATVSIGAVAAHRPVLADLFERARTVDLPRNPWAKCGGPPLTDYLAKPMAAVRTAVARCVAAADAADATIDPALPPFADGPVPLSEQAAARAAWATAATPALAEARRAGFAGWLGREPAAIRRMAERVRAVAAEADAAVSHPPEEAFLSSAPAVAELGGERSAVAGYLAVAGSWSAAFAFSAKADAKRVLARYGLPLDKPSAERLAAFLEALAARAAAARVWKELTGSAAEPTDEQLRDVRLAGDWLDHLSRLEDTPALAGVAPALARVAADPAAVDGLLAALGRAPARAEALGRLEDELHAAGLFGPAWPADFAAKQRRGEPAASPLKTLADRVDTLEGVLRVRDARAAVPADLAAAVDALIAQGTDAAAALAVLDRVAVDRAITDRLRADPNLHRIDARRVEWLFDQYRQLAQRRREHVRDAIEHQWVSRQKERLLAAAGTKLNGLGADLKRRLTLSGKNGRRLRQVIATGEDIDGGDPLFDLCPVWMASPETVAQVFPRRPTFDVVIFDEASQCRLEEALPVLVRGQRAVVAGDPHQLPPTKFFESGFVRSGDDEGDDEGDEQSLFEAHQAQVEDLLSAALNLSVRQSYLDVHYRSRSADLIAFSNEHFYNRRLVPIPSRPSRATAGPAIRFHRVDGTYQRRCNPAEADAVVAIVRELLARPEPPSIGIACLNLPQRDLIVERLDAAADEDEAFAKQLEAARTRSGSGASDGLFVKNLENVQGDERDEIIISTTYGPTADGKFHRRFGPLGMPGGGRRLNVLVTRARDRVHLVTSIPAEAYRSLPPVPEGQQAGGAWLLFAYLKHAEANPSAGAVPPPDAAGEVRPTRYPSDLAQRLAAALAVEHGVASQVYWGNDGFCVDIAPHGSTAGVLVDGCRYAAADDPIDWDVFRTGVLAGQGWRLVRVWSPHFFRDPDGGLKALAELSRGDPA